MNFYIQYNSSNKEYARENRKNPTKAESIFRNKILKKDRLGYRFTRQKPLGPFIADFYCSELLLAIEIDGSSHCGQEIEDKNRSCIINDLGVMVVRYANEEVFEDIVGAESNLVEIIKGRVEGLK